MSVSTIANHYARALADVVIERRESNEVLVELGGFVRLMEQHEELRGVFASPVIALDRKRAVLNDLLSRLKLRQTAANFLQMLVVNSRLHDLGLMVRALSNELDSRSNVVSAEITTARAISQQEMNLLRDKLKAATGKEVRLQFRTDPGIIGGVVTRIGSTVYDGSIKNQLSQMKRKLVNTI
jgi:F-type H+-transporting ATPase subunit delta